ncbi:hypothetical protein OHA84_33395 [Streptomyces sp. NBC_00513]|uniref:hypothetical protein n=1 Tax=unclassified Streptomyces TaxID=2593676 RepID=UPI00224CB250|nr:hypothetical protein [Streptomyces sp. NBC_00424]MCX5071584.1 hypothetical protein [Streptomyces sp. NBC_00424]WUD45021.1 hypothetical protein OHA84_33395 [Streptomyces sp. NBC_00513]
MPTQEIPTLKSQYADKVTADLDLNTAEQDRIRGEITSLQERLAGLEQDHELLVGMRAALGDNALAVPGPRTGKKPATAVKATTPTRKQTGAKTATTGSVKKSTATKTSSAPKSTTAKSTATKSTTAKATAPKSTEAKATAAVAESKQSAAKPVAAKQPVAKKPVAKKAAAADKNQVPLTELIHQHLTGQTEPKTAAEISQALAVAHPDRSLNDNLVRTSTERLVARSLVERAKQGSTVYYTATRTDAVAAVAPAATADKAVAAAGV